MGYAELWKKRSPDDALAQRTATVIIQEAERMADIVRKLGSMTRLESIQYVGNTQIFDLNANVKSPDRKESDGSGGASGTS
jgi:signal transduction histidine kinase